MAPIKHAFEDLAQLFVATTDGGKAVPIPLPSSTDLPDQHTGSPTHPSRRKHRR